MPTHGKLAQYRRTRPRRRGHAGPRSDRSHGRSASQLTWRYGLAIASIVVCAIGAPALALVLYPALGVWLSRAAGARIIWSEHHSTIEATAQAKLRMVLTWPIALPTLILQLWIAHNL